MSKIICPRCHAENASGMAFCTNCGQAFAAPAQNVPQGVPSSASAAPLTANSAPAKSSKNLLYGLLGCGGLLVVFVIGAIVIGIFVRLGQSGQSNTGSGNFNANSVYANNSSSSSNSSVNSANNNSIEQINSGALDEVRSLKQVGAFRQTEVKDVPAGDYYPSASEAVQVTYQNGKQTVFAVVVQFPTQEAALADFEARYKSVKENGGKIYNNANQNGTRGAAYKFKDYYYIEVCSEAICWRNYSSELNAVKTFAINFPNGSGRTKK